jgi:hypothetical protein
LIFFSNNKEQIFQGDYHVSIKQNSHNSSLTDVYLYNDITGPEIFFRTISNVYRDHYHAAEFLGGNLYIIERNGKADNLSDQNWTDELWKYEQTGDGIKLYSAKGIDFRVSSDAKQIVIFSQPNIKKVLETTITLIDLNGRVQKTFESNGLPNMDDSKAITPLFWQGDLFWFTANQGSTITDVFTLNGKDLGITLRSK